MKKDGSIYSANRSSFSRCLLVPARKVNCSGSSLPLCLEWANSEWFTDLSASLFSLAKHNICLPWWKIPHGFLLQTFRDCNLLTRYSKNYLKMNFPVVHQITVFVVCHAQPLLWKNPFWIELMAIQLWKEIQNRAMLELIGPWDIITTCVTINQNVQQAAWLKMTYIHHNLGEKIWDRTFSLWDNTLKLFFNNFLRIFWFFPKWCYLSTQMSHFSF